MTVTLTRQLSSARLAVASDLRSRALMRAALVAVLVTLAVVAGFRLVADGAAAAEQRNRLQRENSALRTEVARLEAELQLEHATGAALDRQVADLDRQLDDLERQLAFVNAQRVRNRTTAQSN